MEHAQYIYDVFIAYASADQEWAEAWLRPRLEQAGLQVCSDDTFDPGVPKLVNLERAIGNSRQPRDVMIVEKLRWSWPRALRSALRSIGIGVLGGVLSAASCTPIGLFLGNDVAAKLDGGARFFLLGLILGGGLELGVGVLLGLFSLLFGGFTSDELPMKSVPNQGIRQSLRNGLRIGAGGGLLAFLLTYPVLFALSRYPSNSTFLYAVYAGLAVALLSGFGFGGYATISHFALRIVLWRNGSIPWNYARFLDHCAERIFLRKVGGGYIFIHRMLMEYFASLDTAWLEPNQRIE